MSRHGPSNEACGGQVVQCDENAGREGRECRECREVVQSVPCDETADRELADRRGAECETDDRIAQND